MPRSRVANAERAERKYERDRVHPFLSVATGRKIRDLPPQETLYLKSKYGLMHSAHISDLPHSV